MLRIRSGGDGKCPLEVSDLVLINNNVLAALGRVNINKHFNFGSYAPQQKNSCRKFFKPYKRRCSYVLTHYRILPVDEEAPTTGTVTWMITTWRMKLAKQELSTVKLEFQSLAHDKQQYYELGDEFASNSHALNSRTALENFKLLIELDFNVLLGADAQWAVAVQQYRAQSKDSNHCAKLLLLLHVLPHAAKRHPLHLLLLIRGMTAAVPVNQKGGRNHRRWRRY